MNVIVPKLTLGCALVAVPVTVAGSGAPSVTAASVKVKESSSVHSRPVKAFVTSGEASAGAKVLVTVRLSAFPYFTSACRIRPICGASASGFSGSP